MTKEKIWALVDLVSDVCPPQSEVEIVPTAQTNKIYLVIVQLPSKAASAVEKTANCHNEKLSATVKKLGLAEAYFWELQTVHKLHYEKIMPLLEDAENFRVVYCCDNKFVFYSKTFGCFDDKAGKFDYIGIKLPQEKDYKYVGHCQDADFVIEHLMTTYRQF